jgi:parallel beta-helix repeat protein
VVQEPIPGSEVLAHSERKLVNRSRIIVVGLALVWVAVGFSVFLAVRAYRLDHRAGSHAHPSAAIFNHIYPPDPAQVERPKVSGDAPAVPPSRTVTAARPLTSFAALARALPSGTVARSGGGWLLTRPAAISGRASLVIDAGRLAIGPGAFLLATKGGTVRLSHVGVAAVDGRGQAVKTPVASRGFLAATEGGVLALSDDRLADLGHLGVQAYGISLAAPGPGTSVIQCTITGNYFGVYTTHARGVRILKNTITDSVIYGIDPHTDSTSLTIEGNHVASSGVHAIILAAGVTHTRVDHNVIEGARDHGIVLYDSSNENTIVDNTISGTFDGLVIQDSSGNLVSGNDVGPVTRFGLRMAGASSSNTIRRNRFTGALVGAYVYDGASRNHLLDNAFAADREFVRVRADSPANIVTPIPPRSEVAGAGAGA